MIVLLKEIRHNPLLWLLLFVPVVFIAGKLWPEEHTLLFGLSVLAIVPLAALLSQWDCYSDRRDRVGILVALAHAAGEHEHAADHAHTAH